MLPLVRLYYSQPQLDLVQSAGMGTSASTLHSASAEEEGAATGESRKREEREGGAEGTEATDDGRQHRAALRGSTPNDLI